MKCKIVHFSDTHGIHEQLTIPDGDILVFSGDCGSRGGQFEVERFFKWFSKQPHIYKIFIPGNHDRCFDKDLLTPPVNVFPFWVQSLREEYCKYETINIFETHGAFEIAEYNLKFFGSAYVPKVHPKTNPYWGFSKEREELAKYWKDIPEDIDILITHGPPYGKLDYSYNGATNVGCERLRYKIERIKPKVHLFGHIHESYGLTYNGDTYFVNSSAVGFNQTMNAPQVFTIDCETKEIEFLDE